MARNILRTGKQTRPKTAVKGKRYRCAKVPQAQPEACQGRPELAASTPSPDPTQTAPAPAPTDPEAAALCNRRGTGPTPPAATTTGPAREFTEAHPPSSPSFALAYSKPRLCAGRHEAVRPGPWPTFDTALRLDPPLVPPPHNKPWPSPHAAPGPLRPGCRRRPSAALRLDPSMAHAHLNRGLAHAAQGRYDAALVDFDATLRLNPGITNAYHNRGFVHTARGDFDQAVRRLHGSHPHQAREPLRLLQPRLRRPGSAATTTQAPRRLQPGPWSCGPASWTPLTTAPAHPPAARRDFGRAPRRTAPRRCGTTYALPPPTSAAARIHYEQGKLRPGRRRLQRTDPARSECPGRLQQPRPGPRGERRARTGPSPTSMRRSGSTRTMLTPFHSRGVSPTARPATSTNRPWWTKIEATATGAESGGGRITTSPRLWTGDCHGETNTPVAWPWSWPTRACELSGWEDADCLGTLATALRPGRRLGQRAPVGGAGAGCGPGAGEGTLTARLWSSTERARAAARAVQVHRAPLRSSRTAPPRATPKPRPEWGVCWKRRAGGDAELAGEGGDPHK